MAKIRPIILGAEKLSLGISIVVAIGIGVWLGFLLKDWTGLNFMLWVGIGFGIGAAVLNVYKAYCSLKKDLDQLKDEYRYAKPNYEDDELVEKM